MCLSSSPGFPLIRSQRMTSPDAPRLHLSLYSWSRRRWSNVLFGGLIVLLLLALTTERRRGATHRRRGCISRSSAATSSPPGVRFTEHPDRDADAQSVRAGVGQQRPSTPALGRDVLRFAAASFTTALSISTPLSRGASRRRPRPSRASPACSMPLCRDPMERCTCCGTT